MEFFKGFSRNHDAPPFNVGIIGMGKMGHLRARYIAQDPRLHLAAVCDTGPEKIHLSSPVPFYADYQQLLDSANVDIIYACAVNRLLPDIVIAALKSGRHVFCEKPPGRSAEDVRRIMAEEARRPELCVYYGFNHRHHYSVKKAKALIDSGEFGELLWMRGIYGKCGGEHFAENWRNRKALSGGGILLDQGIHMLDLFHFFGFEPTDVKSFVSTSYWNIDVEDNAFVLLSNGRQHALLHSSATQWRHRFQLEMTFTKGYINLNGLITSTHSYGDETLTYGKVQLDESPQVIGRPQETTLYFNRDDSWAFEQEDFIRAIKINTPNKFDNDTLRIFLLIDNIYKN